MQDEMPAGLDLLWGLREPPRRERRGGLNADRIVAAAIELADADGLEAASMSRVAERLGFTAMALYRHVRNKDELLVLMLDATLGPPPELDDSLEGWRAQLERWCSDLLAVVNAHPWWLDVPISPPPPTPSQFAWLDRGLAALADTRLDEPEKAAVMLLLNGVVFWEARLTAELGRPAPGSPDPHGVYVRAASTLVDAERFPALRRAVDAGIFEDESRDTEFSFGLGLVLDGVERLVERRAR